jgi:hypothetical protein
MAAKENKKKRKPEQKVPEEEEERKVAPSAGGGGACLLPSDILGRGQPITNWRPIVVYDHDPYGVSRMFRVQTCAKLIEMDGSIKAHKGRHLFFATERLGWVEKDGRLAAAVGDWFRDKFVHGITDNSNFIDAAGSWVLYGQVRDISDTAGLLTEVITVFDFERTFERHAELGSLKEIASWDARPAPYLHKELFDDMTTALGIVVPFRYTTDEDEDDDAQV